MGALARERLRVPPRPRQPTPSRPRPSPAHPVLELQARIGNRGVTLLLHQVQRRAASGADFDSKDVRNDLIRAIDTTVLMIPGGLLSGPTYLPRKVDVALAVSALEGLTPEQLAEVRKSYLAHEGRTLDHDLFGTHAGGTNLSQGNRARLQALMHYDSADNLALVLDTAGLPAGQIAATTDAMHKSLAVAGAGAAPGLDADQLRADAAELRQLLTDKPNESERERIMKLLRNDAVRNDQMAVHYHELFTSDVRADIGKYLDEAPASRALLLLAGDRIGADAAAVEERRKEIASLNEHLADLEKQGEVEAGVLSLGMGSYRDVREAIKKKLEEQRAEQVAGVEATLEAARQEAIEGADASHRATAAAERVNAILGRGTGAGGTLGQSLAAVLTTHEEAVVAATAANSPPQLAAARLMQAVMATKLTPALVEAELRGLRDAAAQEARGRLLAKLASLDPATTAPVRQAFAERLQAQLPESTEALTTAYFDELRTRYNANFAGIPGMPGDMLAALLRSLDAKEESGKLTALLAGHGRLDPVDELVFALEGDHKDIETVKRVLGRAPADKRQELVAQYEGRTHQSLRTVLLGTGKPRVDLGDTGFLLGLASPAATAVLTAPVGGKAKDHDAFVVRELLDEPLKKGGVQEAEFLTSHAGKERDWAVDDSGLAGSLHDLGGSETRELMDETANVAVWDLVTYRALLAAGRSAEADAMLQQIRRDRQRLRHDRAAYSSSVDEFRSKLSAALTIAVDIAIMVALPEAAPFLVGLGATVAGHVAVNVVLYGDKYDASMLKNDVLGAVGSAAGAKLAELALAGKVVGGAAELGEDVTVSVSKTIVREAPEVASASVVAMAKREAVALGKEAITQTAGGLGGGLATGDVNLSPGEIAKGVVIGKVGKGIRGGVRGGGAGHGPAADVRETEQLEVGAKTVGSTADGKGTVKETPAGDVIICHSPCLLIERQFHAELRADGQLRGELELVKAMPEGAERVAAELALEARLRGARQANLRDASEATLRRLVADPAEPRDTVALDELVRRYAMRGVRELVEARRRNTRWASVLAERALQTTRPPSGTRLEYRQIANLDALREMARYDAVALDELTDRYARMTPGEREAAARDDPLAALVEPVEGPQMDRDAEARLTEGLWERRRSAMEAAERDEARARAAGNQPATVEAAAAREAAASGGTLGAMETDIPGIEDVEVRGSPNAPPGPEPDAPRRYVPPSAHPRGQFHAEENLVNALAERLARASQTGRLTEADLQGRVVRMAVDQEICSSCLSGVAQGEHSGVLIRFSADHPGLRIEITDVRTGDFTVFEGGRRVVNQHRTMPIAGDQR
jgi:hypothetical protein